MSQVLNSDAQLFFFDIEETILDRNRFYDALVNRDYAYVFLDICQSNFDISGIIFLGKNYFRKLTDERIPEILLKMREQGKRIFALTSGFPSKFKENKLNNLNVLFDEIIYTKGDDKGPFLTDFITKNNLHNQKCCFIDNHIEKINNVKKVFNESFPSVEIDLFHYEREQNNQITLDEFKKYWTEILEMYNKNNKNTDIPPASNENEFSNKQI